MIAVASSVVLFCVSRKNIIIMLVIGSLLTIKYLFTGDFQFRFIGVALVGWLVLVGVISSVAMLSDTVFMRRVRVLLWVEFFIVGAVTTLQFFNVLPITIGNLTFSNSVVSGFSEDMLGFSRPNGYFYHPYDLAIFLSPFIYWFCVNKRNGGLLGSAVLVYFIYLKSLILWFALAMLSRLLPRSVISKSWLVVGLTMLTAIFVTGLSIAYADKDFTAGRIYLWSLYIQDYLTGGVASVMFGLPRDEISVSRILNSDALFLPHNQVLFFALFGGGALVLLYSYLFNFTLKALDYVMHGHYTKIYLVVCFITLGVTGDLSIMFPFWVAACVATIIFSGMHSASNAAGMKSR